VRAALIRTPATILALLACFCLPTAADATPTARLSAALSPEHLGQSTTIVFGFTIATTTGQVPSPLTSLDLYYPANLGIGTSGLGLDTCSAPLLTPALTPSPVRGNHAGSKTRESRLDRRDSLCAGGGTRTPDTRIMIPLL
jgi:hypothetical protein